MGGMPSVGVFLRDPSPYKFTNRKVNLVTYHMKGRFKTLILIEVVLPCDDFFFYFFMWVHTLPFLP